MFLSGSGLMPMCVCGCSKCARMSVGACIPRVCLDVSVWRGMRVSLGMRQILQVCHVVCV